MKPVRSCRTLVATFVLVLAAVFTVAAAHPDAESQPRVSVHYHQPHKFSESHLFGFGLGHSFDHNNYLQKLRSFLVRKATPMLAPGQHLSITFTDIKLAGSYEPWLGPQWDDVRFMRDIYPPRFDFKFELTGANGEVIRHGTRKLIGMGYLYNQPSMPGNTDPLHYDKGVLARWLQRGPAHW